MKKSRKRQKIPGKRICVTLPAVLLEHYRQTASECGMSVSAVIMTVIRSRNRNVTLLPVTYQQEIRQLNRLLERALQMNAVDPELRRVAESIKIYTERNLIFKED